MLKLMYEYESSLRFHLLFCLPVETRKNRPADVFWYSYCLYQTEWILIQLCTLVWAFLQFETAQHHLSMTFGNKRTKHTKEITNYTYYLSARITFIAGTVCMSFHFNNRQLLNLYLPLDQVSDQVHCIWIKFRIKYTIFGSRFGSCRSTHWSKVWKIAFWNEKINPVKKNTKTRW